MSARGEARRDRIVDYLRRTAGAPSVREITHAAGFNSTGSVLPHLAILRLRGIIEWDRNLTRTIRLTEHRVAGVVGGRPGYWTPA